MIEIVKAVPRFVADSFLKENKFIDKLNKGNVFLIRIFDYNERNEIPKPEFPNVSHFFFDDILPRTAIAYEDVQAMTVKDAKEINDIFNLIFASDDYIKVIINCSAGICRSGAVARFFAENSDIDLEKFHKMNPNIQPNVWVENLLWSV